MYLGSALGMRVRNGILAPIVSGFAHRLSNPLDLVNVKVTKRGTDDIRQNTEDCKANGINRSLKELSW